MEALNEARNKMFAALEATNAVLKTRDMAAIDAALAAQDEAIRAYDDARNSAARDGLVEVVKEHD